MSQPPPQQPPYSPLGTLPGRLNVKVGLVMVMSALCLGILLNQVQPLRLTAPPSGETGSLANPVLDAPAPLSAIPSAPDSPPTLDIPFQKLQKRAWWICYAHLGNMGFINIGGGLAIVVMGSRLWGSHLMARVLLLGGLLHPGAWALIGLTGLEPLRWLGRASFVSVSMALGVLFVQLCLGVDRRRSQLASLRERE
ncbi:MAG: hypothetical protein NW237_13010 [Cyanobacteriota bacterium]|nr:hypothetical protein [Cyanobacteriota bacterium]